MKPLVPLLALLAPTAVACQMTVKEYEPRSTLKVPAHPVTRAKFPFVDVHAHIWRGLKPREIDSLTGEMDQMNLRVMVNLSGTTRDTLASRVKNLAARRPQRFVVFANLELRRIDEPDFGENAARQLEADVRERGAVGLKIYKDLGMDLTGKSGNRVPVDDPRLDPIWATAGRLGIPVVIHTAEPVAFFDPIDRYNERWLELTQFPGRARPPNR
jgi:hypothetical protein